MVADLVAATGEPASVRDDLHAGRVETSLLLALHPGLVRLERAVAGPDGVTMADLVRHGVQAISPTGVLGDPRGRVGRRRAQAVRPRSADQLADELDR